jgi:hypothetical protein
MQRVRRLLPQERIANQLRKLGCTVEQINRHVEQIEQAEQTKQRLRLQREEELRKPSLFRHYGH